MPKTNHDPDEIRRLLELRKSQHLTYQQLSEQSSIPVHVLSYRARQDAPRDESSSQHGSGFVEVVASHQSASAATSRSSGIELLLPGGIRCQLGLEFDEDALTRLLAVTRC